MKKLYFSVFALCVFMSVNAQNPIIDNSFNPSDNGGFCQNIGYNATLLNDNTILSVYDVGDVSRKIIKLNPNGSIINSFNFDSNNIDPSSNVFIYPKIDGSFILCNKVSSIKMYNSDGSLNAGFINPSFTTTSGNTLKISNIIFQNDGKVIVTGNFITVNGTSISKIVRLNSNGSTDTTFSISTLSIQNINSIAIQTDGKYLIAGDLGYGSSLIIGAVLRLNSNGSIDSSFNLTTTYNSTQGYVINGLDGSVNDMKIQPDGKIIIVGPAYYLSYSRVCNGIIRLNTNGGLDSSFYYNDSGSYYSSRLVIQLDGKIVFNPPIDNSKLIRLNPDGSTDYSFIYNNLNYNDDSYRTSRDLKLSENGNKIFINTSFKDAQGITRTAFHKINLNGSLDLTFNPHSGPNANYTMNNFNTNSSNNTASLKFKVLKDQSILLLGSFTSYNDKSYINGCKLTIDGDIDNSFTLDPTVKFYSHADNIKILEQSSGKIVIYSNTFGSYVNDNGTLKYVFRLNRNGSLDTTFNTTNQIPYNYTKIKLLSDDKFLATGDSGMFIDPVTHKYKLIRFNSDGTIDSTFLFPQFLSAPLSFDIQSDNKVLVSFSSYTSGVSSAIERYNTDGTLDTSFIYSGGIASEVRQLPNGKILKYIDPILYNTNASITLLNSDGSIDQNFSSFIANNSGQQFFIRSILQDKIIVSVGSRSNSNNIMPNKIYILNYSGTIIGTALAGYNTDFDFDVQSCDNFLFFGKFNQIDNALKNNIVRYKFSTIPFTPTPTGSTYQSFVNGQTLANLDVVGQNIQWYNNQSSCGSYNDNVFYRVNEILLPSTTLLVNGYTYYASQTINGIESRYRLPVRVNQYLSVQDFAFSNYFSLYPNPVKEVLNIATKNDIQLTSINVYNTLGQLVLVIPNAQNTKTVDVSSLNSGNYFIKINSDKGTSNTSFIKL